MKTNIKSINKHSKNLNHGITNEWTFDHDWKFIPPYLPYSKPSSDFKGTDYYNEDGSLTFYRKEFKLNVWNPFFSKHNIIIEFEDEVNLNNDNWFFIHLTKVLEEFNEWADIGINDLNNILGCKNKVISIKSA